MSRTVLITGGAGFIGSNLALFFKDQLKNYNIICFDNLIRSGSQINVKRMQEAGIEFVKGDVRNKADLDQFSQIDLILECSAEPSVLASFEDPQYTIDTNLIGTIHCLELAKKTGAQFIFLSTSRVYPMKSLSAIGHEELDTRFDWRKDTSGVGYSYEGINMDFPLNGAKSLYGATKLASENIICEYFDMFGLKGVINRFGVIAGPWQMGKVDQGIVGFWLAQHMYDGKLKYIGYKGEGKQVRDALHIKDACALILQQVLDIDKVNHQIFNLGGGRKNAFSLMELTESIQKITKKSMTIESEAEDRKGDIRIYIADNSKANEVMGWQPKHSLEDILIDTKEWIDTHFDLLKNVLAPK